MRPWRSWSLPSPESFAASDLIRVDAVVVTGVPDAFAAKILDRIDWRPGAVWGPRRPAAEAGGLLAALPSLKTVRVSRSWRAKSVAFEIRMREAIAIVADGPAGRLLDADGVVFPDADGVLPRQGLPELELAGLPESMDLRPLARLLAAANEPGALPAPLLGVRFASEQAGWEGFLADGTFLEWGRLEWTGSKLMRLRQVLKDAGPRLPGTLTADMKHFEDGKILIRPR